MSRSQNYFFSSVGKKQIMSLTGLGLVGFTASHLLGNLLILVGADAFNKYAHTLTSNPLIYVAEAILLAMFLTHLFLAIFLKIQNKMARPTNYFVKVKTGRGETFASATMPYTGIILLIFIILHLINFKYGTYYPTTLEGEEIRNLYQTVIEYFSNPWYVVWYVFAMVSLGIHTSHGFHSAFQSLGFNHDKYTPHIKLAACAYGVIVTLGFSVLAIYSYFQN
mgnify:CR=1 FL=1